ncbi:MAG: hypothetical protein QJT81_01955 [Candidatus Thiothrix putei]|uniref:Transmembrane protein n=1 Tax=Candidatus Thiothrix putei TaxID=3080811 RepID=A0AA95HHN1_9GAMM|nr:MAG: hypothetical protein QJT81_01955 [Candidatus Thiothrix putei]
MANKNSAYVIIDENKPSPLSHFVVNPVVILFAAILVPLFWMPPLWGEFWLPLVWLLFNGYALGSAHWKKEWMICITGAISLFLLVFGASYFILINNWHGGIPYLRIAINAVLFLTLYYAVFTQNASYALFTYLKENGESNG